MKCGIIQYTQPIQKIEDGETVSIIKYDGHRIDIKSELTLQVVAIHKSHFEKVLIEIE